MYQISSILSQKSKIIALILCIFWGYFGIHRFYVGKIGTGIIWILSFGLLGLGWIIDIISIATNKFADKHGFVLRSEAKNENQKNV